MIRICFCLILVISMFISQSTIAKPNQGMLVLDARNAHSLPKHFRLSKPTSNHALNWQGFNDLKMIGSGQFSKSAFEKVLNKISHQPIHVFDLRQESHGFLNGNAISWFGVHNGSNNNKKNNEVDILEKSLLNTIESLEVVPVNIILEKQAGKIIKSRPIEFSVHQVNAEATYLENKKIPYHRIYVQDHHSPADSEVDRFIQIIKTISKDQWVYFHCRAGSGRTTSFMLMYDILKNAKSLTFNQLVARQVAIGGKDLSTLPDLKVYKYKYALARLNFLKNFYRYAQTNTDNYRTLWSEWKRKNK